MALRFTCDHCGNANDREDDFSYRVTTPLTQEVFLFDTEDCLSLWAEARKPAE